VGGKNGFRWIFQFTKAKLGTVAPKNPPVGGKLHEEGFQRSVKQLKKSGKGGWEKQKRNQPHLFANFDKRSMRRMTKQKNAEEKLGGGANWDVGMGSSPISKDFGFGFSPNQGAQPGGRGVVSRFPKKKQWEFTWVFKPEMGK